MCIFRISTHAQLLVSSSEVATLNFHHTSHTTPLLLLLVGAADSFSDPKRVQQIGGVNAEPSLVPKLRVFFNNTT